MKRSASEPGLTLLHFLLRVFIKNSLREKFGWKVGQAQNKVGFQFQFFHLSYHYLPCSGEEHPYQ